MISANPPQHVNYTNSPFFLKFADTTIAVTGLFCFLSNIILLIPYDILDDYKTLAFIFIKEPELWLLALPLGLGYSLYWKSLEKKIYNISNIKHVWLRAFIRLVLVYLLLYYGFSKLIGNQLQTSVYHQDLLVRDLNGFLFTWLYFGYSPAFRFLLGIIQVTGAIMLLFSRTTLAGIIILLPVMINIVLINFFYDISRGAFINSIVITLCLTYLLLLQYDKLKVLFSKPVSDLPKIKGAFFKYSLRILILGLGLYSVYQSHLLFVKGNIYGETDEILTGKWKVEQQFVNGIQVQDSEWESDPQNIVWSNIYFERSFCRITSNPYFFDKERSKTGRYTFNAGTGELEIKLNNRGIKEENFQGIVDSIKGDKMTISGMYKNNVMAFELKREHSYERDKGLN